VVEYPVETEDGVKARAHVEVERKYEAGSDYVMPSFEELEGVAEVTCLEEDLDAAYFDTADLRLARAGTGLRRRVGGADTGWHLKLPRVGDARTELRRPLGRAARSVPRPLADLVAAYVRGEPLVPVARVRTHRRISRLVGLGGTVLAEIADDDVQGEAVAGGAIAWREVEAELVSGDDRLLDAIDRALRAAGARASAADSKLARVLGDPASSPDDRTVGEKSSAGDVVVAYVASHVDALLAADPAVRQDLPDAVHKMRVATRRLRSALATSRPVLDRSVTDPLRDELKWLAGLLSPVRDTEVIREQLRCRVDEQPPALVTGPVRRRIDRTLRAEHTRALKRALPELKSARYFRLLDTLDVVAAGRALDGKRSAKPAEKQIARQVGKAHRRMARRLDAALAQPTPRDEDLHEVRKAAKRVRYAAESAEPVFRGAADALAKQMEQVQDVLGEHQDSVVTRDVLRRLAREAEAAGEPSFTYGRLHALEESRGERAQRAFLDLAAEGLAKPPSWLR
jgi:CHAD domain-containing protein